MRVQCIIKQEGTTVTFINLIFFSHSEPYLTMTLIVMMGYPPVALPSTMERSFTSLMPQMTSGGRQDVFCLLEKKKVSMIIIGGGDATAE